MGNTHITTSGVAGESLSEESVRRAAKLIVRADYGQYTLKDAKRLYQLCGDVVLTQETWYDESRARCGVASRRHSHVARTRAGVYGVVRSCLHSYILHLTTGSGASRRVRCVRACAYEYSCRSTELRDRTTSAVYACSISTNLYCQSYYCHYTNTARVFASFSPSSSPAESLSSRCSIALPLNASLAIPRP